MDFTVLQIEGISIIRKVIRGEHTTDVVDCIVFKDEHGNEVQIDINNGKIIHTTWRKSS